jgi:hypothetical protein
MKKLLILIILMSSFVVCQAVFAGDTKEKETGKSTNTVEKVRIPEIFGTKQIKDWQVIDNKNIIIDTYAYGKFKATFTQACPEVSFTETIGFMTQGPYALDENTTIVLSNGDKCVIKELVPYAEKDKSIKK